jgi:hypothetical protein
MTKKLTTEEFIKQAKEVHGDKYDYSKVQYINAKSKVIIICPVHKEFSQNPYNHLKGTGCPKCADIIRTSKRKYNTNKFVKKAKEVHGDIYDFSKTEYKNSKDKVLIIDEFGLEHKIIPASFLNGVNLTIRSAINKTEYFLAELKRKKYLVDVYDYSKVEFVSSKINVIILDENGFEHSKNPSGMLNGDYKLTIQSATNKNGYFIFNCNKIHNGFYDYSLVNYEKNTDNITIICPKHGEFTQVAAMHLSGRRCPKCFGTPIKTAEAFISESKNVHDDIYDYSLVEYIGTDDKVKIICTLHGIFEQTPYSHIKGSGCPICNKGFIKSYQIKLLQELSSTDLLTMDPVELALIIGQGKLPNTFRPLINTEAESEERITTLRELQEQLESETEVEDEEIITITNEEEPEFVEDDVFEPDTIQEIEEPRLPSVNQIGDLHNLDNSIYAGMDEEAFATLIEYKLRKLWNSVLNEEVEISKIENENGSKYFTIIKETFLNEYNLVNQIEPKDGYLFKCKPNLMQKLTVFRLLKNKYYGNWSGTGAGKTLSFILASREMDAKLTIVIALNSTITQTGKAIKSVYPDSKIFTDYQDEYVFNRNNYNFLILNYEKFQQEYSEEMLQQLTNNNQIDFIVIDEVHNSKQRTEDEESLRRGTLNRLISRARENNNNLHVLAMSATPVINNLFEAKSLLQLMSGLEYSDVQTRRTVGNALRMFQHLTLNGLRFIPKYDISIHELVGAKMSNLSIDGSHYLDRLLELSQGDYIGVEQMILEDKLNAVAPYLKKGTIIYSYFTTGFINPIQTYIESLGFRVGTYTGEESTFFRDKNLRGFIGLDKEGNKIKPTIDILIGSRPIGTGVDGLQEICDRMIILSLPWTNAEYEQLKGRIYRQGSIFKDVEIIIPQVKIQLDEDQIWSWDIQRLNLIKNKKTLADAAVDGVIPSNVLPRPETMFRKSQEALERWKERIGTGNIIKGERSKIQLNLYPEIDNESERQKRINSELSEFNRRGKTLHSATMHKEFSDNPESWLRYHALRKSRMETWEEIPYEYIATKIRDRRDVVADFGCGENLMRHCIPNNKVYSFDHVAIDDSVIACDMKNTGLGNETIDVAVFSLALWGANYKDYIVEAHRIMRRRGVIYIAEPSKSYETTEEQQKLIDVLNDCGFQVVGTIENRGKFIYLTGIKM